MTIPTSTRRTTRPRSLALTALLAVAVLATAAPAHADAQFLEYGGSGSYTRVFFDTHAQVVNLPDIREAGPGRLRFRIAFEATTTASGHASAAVGASATAA